MQNTDFGDIGEGLRRLDAGNARQREIAGMLGEAEVLERLAAYRPALAGTLPIGIDIPGSDVDVLCEVYDHAAFLEYALRIFGECEGFERYHRSVDGVERSVVRFWLSGLPIELFGQARPTAKQNGFRHMQVERRLLELDDPQAAAQIRALKRGGRKTEPAFAEFYGLKGDPYAELYRLSLMPDHELLELIRNKK
ncbi:DUF4269 domain-containing protein [Saccharibacillus sp. CPCC 101409]|uniref:DUF4269 domain-containing protein n=1 Tax=Saccharibacillus sp. CPCC 101409 TaxID=3058041 RepID=UPI0026732B19|nr:DUF4269 domain-containing protein [Saccharibacillus sp. CPCC 101409]MDO3411694.1 DUF4269 domain-containing protein [Saccharibacillus sp. CPCC 101409]